MAVYPAFAEQLRKFAAKADETANLVVKKVIFDVSTAIVMKSPVGDAKYWKSKPPPGYVGGRFRANWQYGLDKANLMTDFSIDKTGGPTIAAIVGKVADRVLGHIHYITNNLPYAIPLEEGHSKRQAPAGVVMVTILEFDPIVRAAAAEFS